MSGFSRVWERVTGTGRGANRAKSSKSRSLRMESLEDRALLSVTLGTPDTHIAAPAAAVTAEFGAIAGNVVGDNIVDLPILSDPDQAAANETAANQVAPPQNVQAQLVGAGSVQVSWDRVDLPSPNYTVRYGTDLKSQDTWLVYNTSSNSVTIDDLDPGVWYFKVRAYSPQETDFSELAKVEVPEVNPLPTPELFASPEGQDDGKASITVSWDPDENAVSYTLEYRKSTEGAWTTVTGLEDTYTIENLERETSYDIQVMAIAKPGSGYDNSDYGTATVITPLSDWYLMDYADYTNFRVDATEGTAYLYGISEDGKENELKRASIGQGANLTLYSNSTARNVTITSEAMLKLGEIVYVGGKSKNDTVKLEGTAESDYFMVVQETKIVDVYDRPGKEAKTQQVVFERVEPHLGGVYAAAVKISGIRSVTLDGGKGTNTFNFEKCGTTYDLLGDGANSLEFTSAESGVKLDLGKTKAQSVLSGQKGKLILHGNIMGVRGSRFNDTITTAANTQSVDGNGGSDTIKLVGDEKTMVQVLLQGGAQKVTGKGAGLFVVNIEEDGLRTDGTKSTVNMSSVKNGRLELKAKGNQIKVTGTKGDDLMDLSGSDIDVKGNDGDDIIRIRGANAKARGDKGNDYLFLFETYGKCVLDGGDGNDILVGGQGNDTLKVKSGNNVLLGSRGADKLTGGRGRDCLIANTTNMLSALNVYQTDNYLSALYKLLVKDDMKTVIDMLGVTSVADHEKDVLKRGNGLDNVFFANIDPLGDDFDITDCKFDKGDVLHADNLDEEAQGR